MEETNAATMTMTAAADYMGISKARLNQAIKRGELTGVSKGAESRGPGGGWRIPVSELDRLKAEGNYQPVPKRKRAEGPTTASDRLSITEAAARFGLGKTTLDKYIANGKLPAERAQLGPGRSKTFVRTADVAALRREIPISKRGKHPKTNVTPKRSLAGPPNYPSGLNAELLRAAELVRNGNYTVSKLTLALEFTGGDNETK